MAFVLNPDRNVIDVIHPAGEIEFYAKNPTTSQRLALRKGMQWKPKRGGLRPPTPEQELAAKIKAARAILIGFKEGDIVLNDGDPLKVDPDGRWLDLLEEHAPTLLEAIVGKAYGEAVALSPEEEPDDADQADDDGEVEPEPAEETPPPAKKPGARGK